ncbi:hypothetical protein F5878DRAFT_660683 [Lentinula raphanica]|uniref:Uncharacterized protein n=1 Tax=Lentinula raphanica TaxID=153919 RepID=A0AA38UEQ6_9AGAR|nr:hypothetical protein F5878DRAFT_660683 [Lentinula raphanica]
MTRFTFALILVFLALTIAPEILAAPISVRRGSRDDGLLSRRFQTGPEKSNGTLPEPSPFDKVKGFSATLNTTSDMVHELYNQGVHVHTEEALMGFAKVFDKFNKEKLDLAITAKDEKKAHEEIVSFCSSHEQDLNQATKDAKTLSDTIAKETKFIVETCRQQYLALYNACVDLKSDEDGTKKSDDGTKKSG